MPVSNVDIHRPNFYLFPVNNNRTAWRPFGLPMIIVVPHKRDPIGAVVSNSSIFNVRIYIENVPQSAFVAGHDHIGMRFPDRELYAKTLSSIELSECFIDLNSVTITRNGETVGIEEARDGDLINYITATGVVDTIEYVSGADYYDLSNILLDIELLPSDNYNIVYEMQYYARVVSEDGKSQFLCININSTSLALLRFAIQHPGQVLDEFYRHTPPPYLTNESKALDTTVALYRPFTDILQDVMDEQNLLERINWVFDAPAEAIPYLSSLLGWDLPFFPESLDQLRRAVLRRTVEFQNLKGSRRSIINIFRLFGFEVLITNLWWSSDGTRFIRPGESLPPPYENEEIRIESKFQIDCCLADEIIDAFGEFKIPLLFRPQVEAGLDNFTSLQDGGDITIDAYTVINGSEAHSRLNAIVNEIMTNPGGYGQTANCIVDSNGFTNPTTIHEALAGSEVEGYSQILLSGKAGTAVDEVLAGVHPPLTINGARIDREVNSINLNLNGYFDPNDDKRVFIFVTYSKLEVIVPSILATLQSNRFDLQVLTKTLDEFADPVTLEFAIEFLYRLKAFHSLLNVIRTRIDLTETYEVTDLCVGGDYDQRYNTDIGRLQVPPAIIPSIPGDVTDCTKLDPVSLGYKEDDTILRLRKLANLVEEHNAWAVLDNRDGEPRNDLLRLAVPMAAPDRDSCKFTYRGQDRMTVNNRVELRSTQYGPSPNANQNIVGFASNQSLSPVDTAQSDDFESTGPQPTTNSNSHQYGSFTAEYTDFREAHCTLDGITDYCYKGRVDDEILYRPTLTDKEHVRQHPCNISIGYGVYWAYPTISKVARPGTTKPCRQSKSQIVRFTGKAPKSTIEYHLDGLQNQYLTAPYDAPLDKKFNSFLGRLYRDYDTPSGETIHYTNRTGEPTLDQQSQLALQRHSLEIQKPTLHLPGCRFPRLNALAEDFEHPVWRARPWDDQYSTHCGPKNACNAEPTSLNFHMITDDDGNETLIFDDAPFTVFGNGLIPDINSLGDHQLGSDALFDAADVIHKVYMRDANSKPAITFEQVCPYDENVDSNGLIRTNDPLFTSHNRCGDDTAGTYRDFADGYPCLSGYQDYAGEDIGRSGLYDDIFEGLGLDMTPSVTGISYLFTLGSGIRIENAARLDCGCLLVDCDSTGEPDGTGILVNEGATFSDLVKQSICSSSIFLNEDGQYDWDHDHLRVLPRMVLEEEIGACTIQLDGSIPSLLETF